MEVIRLNGKEVLRESRADTCDSREIRRTTPRERPRTSRCLRLRATFPSYVANRCAARPTRTAVAPYLAISPPPSALSAHRVCQKQLPGLFVFFNFVRNSISQVLYYRGLKTRPLAPRYPSPARPLPFCPSFETSSDSKLRRGRVETRNAKDIGASQWDGGTARRAIGE